MINLWSLPPALVNCRHVFIHECAVHTTIGFFEEERNTPQRLLVSVDAFIPMADSSPVRDSIDEVFNYLQIKEVIEKLATDKHHDIQETLCDEILTAVLMEPRIIAAQVRCCKPDIFEHIGGLGVSRFLSKVTLDQPLP